ncbi:MAG: family 20 glycosylhydrolase [Actinomycetaceae bacterium]|nr:family 20 glycosylhydrolase [Actinomycetaceae bacterium]MDY5854779.1 family 20 glycosylhydrolase [Arcanobacterium sp.]
MRIRKFYTYLAASAAACLAGVGIILPPAPAAAAQGDAAICANNIAQGRQVYASGREIPNDFGPEKAVDGDIGPDTKGDPTSHNATGSSRWSANNANDAWITVDFDGIATVDKVQLYWGNTFGQPYALQASDDNQQWTDLVTSANGVRAASTEHTFDTPKQMQYLRMKISGKSQQWALSLWEISVCGSVAPVPEPEPELIPTASYASIIPAPLSAQLAPGELSAFQASAALAIKAAGDAQAPAGYLAGKLRTATGWEIPVAADADGTPLIEYVIDPALNVPGVNEGQKGESYTLNITADKVTITARNATGALWGTQTLLQLLGPWAHFGQPTLNALYQIPAGTIADGPRFSYRGVMVDPARSFIPKDELMDLMDLMSSYKMNILHLHLTDDPGWRIEIPNEGKPADDVIDYSLLTSRGGATAFQEGESQNAGGLPGRTGYYTLADYDEIVSTANSLGLTIVPEVDGPGHMESALYSIPQLNSEFSYPKPAPGESTVPVPSYANNMRTSLDPTNEHTYKFTQQVLNLIAEKSNSPYLHIGGDEANVTQRNHYLTYMERVLGQVNALNKTPIVWNEAMKTMNADTDLLNGAVVQSWSEAPSAVPARRDNLIAKGGKFIVSPAAVYYYPQHEDPSIPGPNWACGGNGCTLQEAYAHEPQTYVGVNSDNAILGVSGAMWSEHLRTYNDLQFSVFPRMLAHAEIGWTPKDGKNWQRFRKAVAAQGNALNTANATFFKGPLVDWKTTGAWAADYVPEVTAKDSTERLLAYASAPGASAENSSANLLTATLTLTPKVGAADPAAGEGATGDAAESGTETPAAGDAAAKAITVPVRLELDTPYHFTDAGRTTGRQMNSVFHLYASYENVPAGEYDVRLDLASEGLESGVIINTLVVNPKEVTPATPSSNVSADATDPVSCTVAPHVVIPESEGVVYSINGEDVAAGTHTYGYGETVVVSARALPNYVLAENAPSSWEWSAPIRDELNCDPDPSTDPDDPGTDNPGTGEPGTDEPDTDDPGTGGTGEGTGIDTPDSGDAGGESASGAAGTGSESGGSTSGGSEVTPAAPQLDGQGAMQTLSNSGSHSAWFVLFTLLFIAVGTTGVLAGSKK